MKKLALFCGMAALGLCAMNASATIPKYYESANFTATLTVQGGDETVKTISANNKDLLYLISLEYGTPPTGAQLAIYDGLAYDGELPGDWVYFYVLNPNGSDWNYVSESGSYELYYYPFNDSLHTDWVEKYDGSETYTFMLDQSELYYQSGTGYYFYIWGLTKDTVNYKPYPYSESYSMTMGQGAFYLPIGVLDDYGTVTGTLSGSGTGEYVWDY